MTREIREQLQGIGDALQDVLAAAFDGEVRATDDAALLGIVSAAADVIRRAEGVLIATVGEVQARSTSTVRDERLTTRLGCRTVGELIQRATRFGAARTGEIERVARAVHRPVALTGEQLAAPFPALRGALRDGVVGVDAAAAIVGPLQAAATRASRAGLLAADTELAAAACGDAPDAPPPASAAELRAFAQVWGAYLDQDGAEPREAVALRKRELTLGREHDGLVPVRGELLVEVAAQLQRLFHSILNPKNPPGVCFVPDAERGADAADDEHALAPPPDRRTRAQKQHDALATALNAAAAAGGLPDVGGAAPTLVVTAREQDLGTGRGRARIPGSDVPVPVGVAAHTGCVGNVQRVVLDRRGRIVSLSFAGRVFTAHQRRAILARDGGCFIPGCNAPPEWCEIHHVIDAARGGPTHTDNGVAVCWHHHRTLETSGWEIRMRDGVPEIRGPAWWDPARRWRPGGTRRWRAPEDSLR